MSNPVLVARDLNKFYADAGTTIPVLQNLNFTVNKGESVAIVGSSGSGKSTLLHCLGGLDRLNSGQILIKNIDIHTINESERSLFRNKQLGFIYQFHHLLPEFTALENVMMPLLIAGNGNHKTKTLASNLLMRVGLGDRQSHKPSELSGGEKQRVAIARALVTSPAVILADEPTGNLDQQTAEQVFEVMLTLNQECQTALVMVTHDPQLARKLQHCFVLDQGKLHNQNMRS